MCQLAVLTVSCQQRAERDVDTQVAGQRCIQDLSGLYFRTSSSDLAIDSEVRLASFTLKCVPPTFSTSTEFSVQELFRTESSIPRTSGLHVDLPALYRPSKTDTCFAISSALRPLVQISTGVLIPEAFACCTTFRAFRLCTNQ